MAKFKVVKKLSLDFLGDDWKDAYINFQVLTIADIKNKFPALANLDVDDPKSVVGGMDTILDIHKDKFVEGKGPGNKELVVADLEDLPAELMKRALDFLSQGVTTPSSPQ